MFYGSKTSNRRPSAPASFAFASPQPRSIAPISISVKVTTRRHRARLRSWASNARALSRRPDPKSAGESVLVHGGGSGVGTAVTTLCKLAGLRVLVTAGSKEKCDRCLEHGADVAIDYTREDFAERAAGVNVILDHIGAKYLLRDLRALAIDGRVVIIGALGGDRMANVDVGAVMSKRQQIIGSMLRSRSAESKASIVAHFIARFGADLDAGRIQPVIDRVFPIEQVAEAHRAMKGDHFGKIVLKV